MKTEEDEAFEDIERRQSGFQAKRKMAANKLWDRPSVAFDEWWNGDNDESTNPFRLESGAYWAWAGWKAALAQPAQEPVALECTYGYSQCKALEIAMQKTPKREWIGLTPEETSGFTQHEMTVVKYISKVLQEKNT